MFDNLFLPSRGCCESVNPHAAGDRRLEDRRHGIFDWCVDACENE